MTPAEVERFHAAAVELADEARRLVRRALTDGYRVDTKADRSLVTEADRAVEARVRELVGRWFPAHGVIGEELPPSRPGAEHQWIVDPIDGTEEFVHGIPTFGTMLALHYRDAPLVGVIDHPALDLRVHAAAGRGAFRNDARIRLADAPADLRPDLARLVMSARVNFARHVDEGPLFEALTRAWPNHRIYRAAYAHTVVVSGGADAMVDMHNHVWDLGPARVLIEEAGGRYVQVRDFPDAGGERLISAVFGRPAVVERLLPLFGEPA